MLSKELKKIKKFYGEKMMHFCRSNFCDLLETEELVYSILIEHFNPNKKLMDDIIKSGKEQEFKSYIYSYIDVEKSNENIIVETPEELMKKAGYTLYKCETEEDVQKFKKYYAKGEKLCTFSSKRLNNCYIWFAVKDNVNEIRREDFKNPKREDLYGTSVISIQFSRNKNHYLSIKNRYNHTVNNPDNTFCNNLDNIIEGLTESFAKYEGMEQAYIKSCNFELPNYVLGPDNRYYKYNYEINTVYYCTDNVLIFNDTVKNYSKEQYILIDYFLLNLKTKTVFSFVEGDGLSYILRKLEKIEITKIDKNKIVYIKEKTNGDIFITLNEENQIIELSIPKIKEIKDCFLEYNKTLIKLSLPEVEKIESDFLKSNKNLEILELPKLKSVKDYFLYNNQKIKNLNLPSLEITGKYFLFSNSELTNINMPKLENLEQKIKIKKK